MDLKIFKKFSLALFAISVSASVVYAEGMGKAYNYGTDNPERQERVQGLKGEQKKDQQTRMQGQQGKQQQQQAQFEHKVIEFSQNEVQLSEEAKKQLQELITSARSAGGEIADIKVAAWSDKEFPPQAGASFTDQDQNLADKRLDQVENYLEESLNIGADLDTYNMGEEANALAKLFNTDAAELKSALAKRGAAEGLSEELVNTMRENGGAGKAVVVVKKQQRTQDIRPENQRRPTVPGGQTGTEGRDADTGTGTMNDGIPDSGSPEI